MSRIKFDPFLNKLDQKEPLKDTLTAGNSTEGTDIEISHGDNIVGELSGNSGHGGDVSILGGPSFAGEGGDLILGGGASMSNNGGDTYIAGGIGSNGGNVYINVGSPLGGGLSGSVFINNFEFPLLDGMPGYVMTTDGNGLLSFEPVSGAITDSISATLTFLSGAIDQNTLYIETLSADLEYISGVVDTNTSNIVTLSGIVDTNTTDIATLSANQIIIENDIDTISALLLEKCDDIDTLSADIEIIQTDIINLSADIDFLSGEIDINTSNILTEKDSIIIESLSSEFFAYEPVSTFNTIKWLISAVNPVSSTLSVFEVLGTQINNSPVHSRSNIVANNVDVSTNVIISGGLFGLNIVNNEDEDITIEYIKIT
jgi:hypothetical protein